MTGWLEVLYAAAPAILDSLIRASLQGAVFVLLVWGLCRLMPRLPASVRCMLWWLAALKLIVAFVWVDPLSLPILYPPPTDLSQASSQAQLSSPTDNGPLVIPWPAAALPAVTVASTPTSAASTRLWAIAGVGVWFTTLALLTGALARRIYQTVRMVDRAANAPDEVQAAAGRLAASLRLRRVPAVRLSTEVDTPMVLGFPRAVVLLPASRFRHLQPAEQRMALAHELVHLRRGDPWLGYVPALAERLFFFHPLARLAVREYQLTREAACDAAVIRELGAATVDYGRLLLALGVSRMPAGVAAAGTSNSHSHLKRRITMLREASRNRTGLRRLTWIAALFAACAIIPVEFVAQSAAQAPVADRAPRAQTADPQPAAAPAPAVHPAAPAPAAHPAPPAPAAHQTAAGASHPAPHPAAMSVAARQVAVNRHSRDFSYVLFLDRNQMMAGSGEDVTRAKSFRRGDEEMLWFRRGGREYVSRDRSLLKQVQGLFRPVEELGMKMGEIGAKRGEIGARQAEVGSRQAEVGKRQGAIGARLGEVAARRADLAAREARTRLSRETSELSEAEAQALDREQKELEVQMQQLKRQMDELHEQMRAVGSPMDDLSSDMKALGAEMDALGDKMKDASAKASAEMSSLLDRAVASGTATEVK